MKPFLERTVENLYDFTLRPFVVHFKMILGPLWQDPPVRRNYRSVLKKLDLVLSSKIIQKDLEEIVGKDHSRCMLVNPSRKDGNLGLDALYSR